MPRPPERELEPRDPELRELVDLARPLLPELAPERPLAPAAPPDRLLLVREPLDADRAPLARLEPDPEDLARLVVDFLPLDFALDPDVLFRVPVLARELDERELDALLRPPLELREPPPLEALRDDPEEEPEDEPEPDEPSSLHLPDITRCAASATASAIIEPRRVALDTTLLAACDAVSAASSPASRILRRAAGLALIAAAAAASPAASISLLIAALASLSTVLSLDLEAEREEDLEELFLADFAIA